MGAAGTIGDDMVEAIVVETLETTPVDATGKVISLPAIAIWAALVILGAVLATEAAATRASRITVREALAYL